MSHPLALSSFELHKLMRSGAVSLQIRHYQTDEDRRVQRFDLDRRRRQLLYDAGLTARGTPRKRIYRRLDDLTGAQRQARRRAQTRNGNRRRRGLPELPVEAERTFEERFLA